MFNNQATQVLVTFHEDDKTGLANIINAAVHWTGQLNVITGNDGPFPVATLCFESINALSHFCASGLFAAIDIGDDHLVILDEAAEFVKNVQIYDTGTKVDPMIVAPRTPRTFTTLAHMYCAIQKRTKSFWEEDDHRIERERMPGFMDLSKPRPPRSRSVDSVFGDTTRRTHRRDVPCFDIDRSIHHPIKGIDLELGNSGELHMRVDGEVARRARVDQIGAHEWLNIFRTDLLRNVATVALEEAADEVPGVKLIKHGPGSVEFMVKLSDDSKPLYSIDKVEEDLSLLVYEKKDEKVLLTNVCVDPRQSGPYKGAVSSEILALGDKNRNHIGGVTYQDTGLGIMLHFLTSEHRDEWIANVEAKRNPKPVEEVVPEPVKEEQIPVNKKAPLRLELDDNDVPTLVTNKGIRFDPSVSEDEHRIYYSITDAKLKKLPEDEIRSATRQAPLDFIFIDYNPKKGIINFCIDKSVLTKKFTIQDGKLMVDDEEVGVVAKWNNSFALSLPTSVMKYSRSAVFHGLSKVLGITNLNLFTVTTGGDNELHLSLGKGHNNRTAKKLLASMYTTVETKPEDVQEQTEQSETPEQPTE